jgi:hypothetical protein
MASIDMLGAHSAWDNKYRILPIENSLYKLLQLFIPLVVILGLVDFSKATEGGGGLGNRKYDMRIQRPMQKRLL